MTTNDKKQIHNYSDASLFTNNPRPKQVENMNFVATMATGFYSWEVPAGVASNSGSTETATGYIVQSPKNTILITEDRKFYFIHQILSDTHDLRTGDRVKATIFYSPIENKKAVEIILDVQRYNYTELPTIKSDKTFSFRNEQVRLGTSVLINTELNSDPLALLSDIIKVAPQDTTKIVLSYAGRYETIPDSNTKLFRITPTFTGDEKMSACIYSWLTARELMMEGKDVILMIDSMDKMATEFNNYVQKLKLTLDPNIISQPAFADVESIIYSSKTSPEHGSLTIIGLHRKIDTPAQNYYTERFYQLFDTIIK